MVASPLCPSYQTILVCHSSFIKFIKTLHVNRSCFLQHADHIHMEHASLSRSFHLLFTKSDRCFPKYSNGSFYAHSHCLHLCSNETSEGLFPGHLIKNSLFYSISLSLLCFPYGICYNVKLSYLYSVTCSSIHSLLLCNVKFFESDADPKVGAQKFKNTFTFIIKI